jgi:thiosulfate/3-mercaptopyruvate sulfurtransferase
LVDARAPERYRGETEPIDPRPGHIPGAVNLPYCDNLTPDGRFLDPHQLRARFASAGIDEDAEVVAYCGSGVSACHDLLAMEAAGLGPGRLYPGSWSEWSADRGRPAATGPGR